MPDRQLITVSLSARCSETIQTTAKCQAGKRRTPTTLECQPLGELLPVFSAIGGICGIADYQLKDGAKTLRTAEGHRALRNSCALIHTYSTPDFSILQAFFREFLRGSLYSAGTPRGARKPSGGSFELLNDFCSFHCARLAQRLGSAFRSLPVLPV